MSQILHIFRKDVRHHWPESLLSLAVVIAYAVDQPRHWTGQPPQILLFSKVLEALPFFIVLSWAFFIVRIVQDETLVGDRQFWITRPYEWHKLLAAKLLSIVMFLHLPLFVAQLILLKLASFPVISSIPGLLLVHLMLAMILALFVLALASIASGVGQAALVLLILFLIFGGIAALTSYLPSNDVGTDDLAGIIGLLYLALTIGVVVFQYKFRRALVARLAVGGAIVLIVLIVVTSSYIKLTEHNFPLPVGDHPLPAKFLFDKTLSFEKGDGQTSGFRSDTVELEFPMQLKEFTANTILQMRGVKLDLDLPNGQHWTTNWESHVTDLTSGRSRSWPSVSVKREIYNRFRSGPVTARLSLAFDVYGVGQGSEVSLKGDHLGLPENVRCLNDISQDLLQCFAPLKEPSRVFIMADLPNSSCSILHEQAMLPWAISPAFYANLNSDAGPEPAFTPVQQFNINLMRSHGYEDRDVKLPVCADTSLFVSKPEFRYHVRTEIDLGDIVLQRYHPSYPRKIVPPLDHHTLEAPSDTLSYNIWSLPFGFPRWRLN